MDRCGVPQEVRRGEVQEENGKDGGVEMEVAHIRHRQRSTSDSDTISIPHTLLVLLQLYTSKGVDYWLAARSDFLHTPPLQIGVTRVIEPDIAGIHAPTRSCPSPPRCLGKCKDHAIANHQKRKQF